MVLCSSDRVPQHCAVCLRDPGPTATFPSPVCLCSHVHYPSDSHALKEDSRTLLSTSASRRLCYNFPKIKETECHHSVKNCHPFYCLAYFHWRAIFVFFAIILLSSLRPILWVKCVLCFATGWDRKVFLFDLFISPYSTFPHFPPSLSFLSSTICPIIFLAFPGRRCTMALRNDTSNNHNTTIYLTKHFRVRSLETTHQINKYGLCSFKSSITCRLFKK